MTVFDLYFPLRDCMSRLLPCLSDPGRRPSWAFRAAIVLHHVIFVGILFLLDAFLIRKTREQPWYTAIYMVLFVGTLIQYFFTSGSSPGYVIDATRAGNGTHAIFVNVPNILRNRTCPYCNIIQPPRSKHCHDCDRCILQFDHHCPWLGTCIGQGNHCRFWWYVFEETILCIWTGLLYITFLQSNIKAWWKDFIVIVLLAALTFCFIFLLLLLLFHSYLLLTNQTTYELMRRQRILYLRGIPDRVHPFSKGICRNLYSFCCSKDNIYTMEAVPTMEEIETRARPYTCLDISSCRCC